jgi:hydroxyethylthiazole kinase-like uncharacterized protein yjeF
MSTNSERILGKAGLASQQAWPLLDVAHTRALETAQSAHPGSASLMQIAGLALARLALALVPHTRVIWIACGPGNNGGDGLEAAAHLQQWGKHVVASLVHDPALGPPDARQAWAAAKAAGVTFTTAPPESFDLCLDALFGIGSQRPLTDDYALWATRMNASDAPTLAVDVPSGLQADTGALGALHVVAHTTLSLLTLKPGLFTGGGRDACGEIWFNNLGVPQTGEPQAWLSGPATKPHRLHASHKGSYGDVCVVGGANGMAGAALLAARSALHAGAGRVFVCPLGTPEMALDAQLPELMFRRFDHLDWHDMTIVAGCGGGDAIAEHLPALLRSAKRLVLDADALNHIAASPDLQNHVARRPAGSTVMTPHPLEAARLLACTAQEVQADRLGAARALTQRYPCAVVLKGSGSIVAAPGQIPRINPTGNAKLATAGTGDALAGLVGARLAGGLPALDAASSAAYQHGLAADCWPGTVLSASDLCRWA